MTLYRGYVGQEMDSGIHLFPGWGYSAWFLHNAARSSWKERIPTVPCDRVSAGFRTCWRMFAKN
jgi:hypothetical protein